MSVLPTNPQEVATWIPHRAPMLLVDAVTQADETTLVANRTFREEEFFFQGHFPDFPILPGVIVLEALAQAAALHTSLNKQLPAPQVAYRFSKVDKVTWPNPVMPGQTVTLHITKLREKLGFLMFSAQANVGDLVVCEANFTAKVIPR